QFVVGSCTGQPLHHVDPSVVSLQGPVPTESESTRAELNGQLCRPQVLELDGSGCDRRKDAVEAFEIRRVGPWDDVDVLRCARISVNSNGKAADDKELDTLVDQGAQDRVHVELARLL